MNESKKSSGKKDFYKYQKNSYQRNFQNSIHINHHKYNKYKNKYNFSNSSNKFRDEMIFRKIFEDKNTIKNNNYKKLDDIENTPIHNEYNCEDKENISPNSNITDIRTREKTKNIKDENNSDVNDNFITYMNKDSEEFLIEEYDGKEKNEESSELISEINDINNNKSNIDFKNTDTGFIPENSINDLLQKNNNECYENQKDNIDLKNNNYITPQQFKTNSINSKLSSSDEMNKTEQNNFFEKRYSLDNFNLLTTIKKPFISLSDKRSNIFHDFGMNNSINKEFFINNKLNNFNKFNNSITSLNNFNIPPSQNIQISPFNLFEPNKININNIPNLSPYLNSINNNHEYHHNPFHNMMPQMELNQCILKTKINNNNLFEKDKENTDILEINVKVSQTETLTFKIRRYDDMFRTVKMFCEINKLDIKLIRPLIMYIIKALNSIYGIYNLILKKDEIEFLKEIKKEFYGNENGNGVNSVYNDKEEEKYTNEKINYENNYK